MTTGYRNQHAPHVPDHIRYAGWYDFRAHHRPGPYSRHITPTAIQRDNNDLRLILIAARLRLDAIDQPIGEHHRQVA